MEPKGKNAIYHTVVNDNDNLQILCLLKYAARCLRNKNHQSLTVHKLFSSTTTGRGRLLFKAVAFLQRDTRSKTYCALFPALQPREFIELREELLLRNCEHKHVQKYTYLEPNSTILSHKLPISHEKDGASDIINSKSHPVFFTCWEWKSRVCRVCLMMNIKKKEATVSTQRRVRKGGFSGNVVLHHFSVVESLTFFLWIPIPVKGGCSSYSMRPCSCFLEKYSNWLKEKLGWQSDRKTHISQLLSAEGAEMFYCNLRLNESVVRVQLDTYERHHQTSHCRVREVQRGGKAVDTESVAAGMNVSADIVHTASMSGEHWLTAGRCRWIRPRGSPPSPSPGRGSNSARPPAAGKQSCTVAMLPSQIKIIQCITSLNVVQMCVQSFI